MAEEKSDSKLDLLGTATSLATGGFGNALFSGLGSSLGGGSDGDAPPGDMSSRSYGTFNQAPKIVGDDPTMIIILVGGVVVLALFAFGGKRRG